MDYRQAIDYLSGFTNWERTAAQAFAAVNFDLRRVYSFLARLGNPHRGRRTVHVAGSKGKGSIAAMTASILTEASPGGGVGLYTSPHLHTFCERVAVDGRPITQADFARLTEGMAPAAAAENADGRFGQLTTFELLTALAFLYFRERDAGWQVLEVGMGGRRDATSVAEDKDAAVVGPISLEHTAILGETVEEIAAEKAAIVRPACPVVMASQPFPGAAAVIRRQATDAGAPLVDVAESYSWQRLAWDLSGQGLRLDGPRGRRELWLPLLGAHQLENAAAAVAVIDVLLEGGTRVPEPAIAAGLRQVRWPGRMEVLRERPLVVADGAHNGDSARRLREALRDYFQFRRLILVSGVSQDKTVEDMARELAPLAELVIATSSRHPRAGDPADVAAAYASAGAATEIAPSVAAGVERALAVAAPEDLVCVVGSLFVAAEAREHILKLVAEV
jgi:dihydrofolate synthase / folylpolyglutamate synthase